MHEANTALLDILVDNSVIMGHIRYTDDNTKLQVMGLVLTFMERWAKRLFVGF